MKKRILAIAGVILISALAVVFIWQLPLFRAAHTLSKADNFSRFNFDVELNIDENNLSDKQLEFVDKISNLLGAEPSAILNLKASGSLYDDNACAVIYCGGLDMPVTKVYIHDEETFINVKMLYELIKQRLAERYSLLDILLPDWNYGEYITDSQLETIFGVDFEELFTIKIQDDIKEPSFIKCITLLFNLERIKNEDGDTLFKTNLHNYDISFAVDEVYGVPEVYFDGILNSGDSAIKSFRGEVSFDLDEVIAMPGSIVSQDTADGFAKVWSILAGVFDKIT